MSSTREPRDFVLPRLDDDEEERLLVALEDWVTRLREPDRPFVGYQGLDVASPREVVEGVATYVNGRSGPRGELGRRYLGSISSVLEEIPFDLFIASIERSGSPRLRPLRWLLELRDRAYFETRRGLEGVRRRLARRDDDDLPPRPRRPL